MERGSPPVEFMVSNGSLLGLANFSGLKSILSGSAGRVVGYAHTPFDAAQAAPATVIGVDVRRMSMDVSRYDGWYEIVYETKTAGVTAIHRDVQIIRIRLS
ncbi:hypothetical protein FIBSPDRAFT_764980 [Athelia psychrophila]|uniref:Hydantoinase A/oxoprolinase domain-containing protein n=1 Tax=Athelia psychrophila TaxID=1759441 RepID=A0A167WFL7_9AGAM|nr:hypothetical protein FIBSPDRAFT_764980 [Fibularhizoctonia sp. CBS 109695]